MGENRQSGLFMSATAASGARNQFSFWHLSIRPGELPNGASCAVQPHVPIPFPLHLVSTLTHVATPIDDPIHDRISRHLALSIIASFETKVESPSPWKRNFLHVERTSVL